MVGEIKKTTNCRLYYSNWWTLWPSTVWHAGLLYVNGSFSGFGRPTIYYLGFVFFEVFIYAVV